MYELSTTVCFSAELTRSLQQLVADAPYTYIHPGIQDIPKRCLASSNVIRMLLLRFTSGPVSPETPYRIIAELGKSRPANLRELLLFGRRYPKMQKRFPIFALSSERRPSSMIHDVPFLYGHHQKGRWLQLRWPVMNWTTNDRFLIIQ